MKISKANSNQSINHSVSINFQQPKTAQDLQAMNIKNLLKEATSSKLKTSNEEFWDDKEKVNISVTKITTGSTLGKTLETNKEAKLLYSFNRNYEKISSNIKNKINSRSNSNENYSSKGKKLKGHETSNRLYEKGKMKSELNKIIHQKNIEAKEKEELRHCTFKPTLNSDIPKDISVRLENNHIYEFDLSESIYDRTYKWKSRSLIKTSRLRFTNNDDWTFQPEMNMNDLNSVFEDKGFNQNNLIKKFVERHLTAREQKQTKDELQLNREAQIQFSPKLLIKKKKIVVSNT